MSSYLFIVTTNRILAIIRGAFIRTPAIFHRASGSSKIGLNLESEDILVTNVVIV